MTIEPVYDVIWFQIGEFYNRDRLYIVPLPKLYLSTISVKLRGHALSPSKFIFLKGKVCDQICCLFFCIFGVGYRWRGDAPGGSSR